MQTSMSDMRYDNVSVEALGYALPEERLATTNLEQRLAPLYAKLGIKQGLLETLTGVIARRLWPINYTPAQAAIDAAKTTLANTSFPKNELVLSFTQVYLRTFWNPSTASIVHGALNLSPTCLNFDIGNACLGFLTGSAVAAAMIENGQIEAALVVAGESSRPLTDATLERLTSGEANFMTLSQELASLTLGSAGVAWILTHSSLSQNPERRLIGGSARSATEFSHLCQGTMTQMRTDAPKLLAEGISIAKETFTRSQAWLKMSTTSFNAFCMHQVGKANHEGVLKALGIPPDRTLKLYPELGNTGAAAVPLALAFSVEKGLLPTGASALLMGIGSGLNCWMMGVRW